MYSGVRCRFPPFHITVRQEAAPANAILIAPVLESVPIVQASAGEQVLSSAKEQVKVTDQPAEVLAVKYAWERYKQSVRLANFHKMTVEEHLEDSVKYCQAAAEHLDKASVVGGNIDWEDPNTWMF